MTTNPEATTLPHMMREAALRWPDRTAASFPDAEVTFRALWRGAAHVANALIAEGVGAGDHVGLLIPNSSRLLESFFAVSMIGAIPVVMNTRYRAEELPHVIKHADMVGIVTIADTALNNAGERIDYVARLGEALPGLAGQRAGAIALPEAPKLGFILAFGPRPEPWIGRIEPGQSDETPVIQARRQAVGLSDTAVLLYTSGTTSRPKGVVLLHEGLTTSCIRAAVDRLAMTEADVIWNPAPMCHISAFVALIGSLATGAEYVSASHFDADMVLEHLARRKPTIAFANFPAFYFGLQDAMRRTGLSLDSLKLVTTAAAPPEIERIRAAFPKALQISVTGSTELSGSICINNLDDTPAQRAETAGPPIRGVELSIRDPETSERRPQGEIGELWVRGICLFARYHKEPGSPLTGESEPGWFRTADLGTLDEGGRLTFKGRIKDMLKVGGENVSAAEIETFLLRHPAVAVAQVVAAPDDRLGEVPAAFIELARDATATAEEIVAYCKAGIAKYKVPRIVRFVREWPTSATKIQKERLRAML
ncbi:MAG: class I adenylate-forming enzyme family protein [Rhizobiaceae bacterium]